MRKVLVCDPTYFEVSYEINPWMKGQQGLVNGELAKRQWHELVNALTKVCDVQTMKGVQGLPDMVFTANAGLVVDDIFLVSRFATEERQPEEEFFVDWATENPDIFEVVHPMHYFEGEGDCLCDDRTRLWLGHGFRSEMGAALDLFNTFDNEIESVVLVDPRWYHLDTAFCPLGNDRVMWYPSAFNEASQVLIRNSFKQTIDLSEHDALSFAANCVHVDEHLFLPTCSKELLDKLNGMGYTTHTFDLSEFLKSGGAAKCLTLYLE